MLSKKSIQLRILNLHNVFCLDSTVGTLPVDIGIKYSTCIVFACFDICDTKIIKFGHLLRSCALQYFIFNVIVRSFKMYLGLLVFCVHIYCRTFLHPENSLSLLLGCDDKLR